MFPEIAEIELNMEETETSQPIGKSFLFDFETGEFVLKDGKLVELHGIDALKMWIEKVIRTEKFRFEIYADTEYGTTIEDLIGSNYPRAFIESELKREITEVLVSHPHISNIENWSFHREKTKMHIHFTVVTMEGAFDQEVNLNV